MTPPYCSWMEKDFSLEDDPKEKEPRDVKN